jgi:ketosteroid isomerase-like protein
MRPEALIVAAKREDNIEFAKTAYDAIARADIEWLQAHTHPDVEFQQGGTFPTAGIFHGRDAMFGHFIEFMTMVDGQFSMDIHDILAGEDRVAVYLSVTVGWRDKKLTFDEVHLWRIAEGLLVDMRAIPFDPYVVDNFFQDDAAAAVS